MGNEAWAEFPAENPTRQQIFNYGHELANFFGLIVDY